MPGSLVPIVSLLAVGGAHAYAWRTEDGLHGWFALGAAYALAILISLAYLRREEALQPLMRPVSGDATQGIFGGALALGATYGVALLVLKLRPEAVRQDLIGIVRVAAAVKDPRVRAVAIVAFAVTEEVVWRGAVTRALEGRFGSARAPWIASLLFVLSVVPAMHFSLILAAVLLAAVSAVLVRRTGRVVPACVAHAAFTWFLVELVLGALVQRLRAG
jgi:membrane protease YdiL (CAAX protease family)